MIVGAGFEEYEMMPLVTLVEAVVLYDYSHDSKIVLKNPFTLTSSKATLSLFGSEIFGGPGRRGRGHDNITSLAVTS